MSESPPTRACRHCGYDLSGCRPNHRLCIRCPECGISGSTDYRSTPLSKQALHRQLVLWILLPTIVPSALVLLLTIWFDALWGFGCLIVPAVPILTLFLVYVVLESLIEAVDDKPRPTPKWAIPLWILLYLLPGAIAYYLIFGYLLGKISWI